MAKDRKASLTRIFNKKKGATSSSSSPSSSSAAPSPPSTSMDSARQLVAEPEKMNGSSSSSSVQPSSSRLAPSRTRSGSLSEKGAAVLRALQRAPEDESPEDTPPGALTPHLEVDTKVEAADDDAGYAPEGLDGVSPRPLAQHQPRNGNGGAGDLADVSRAGSIVGLSEEQKLQGRANREGLRRRGEAKEVEKIVGSGRPGARRGGSGSEGKKSKKSWEIPRKIFHSSIGFLVLYLYLAHHNLGAVVRGLSIFLGIVITADVIRLNNDDFERIYEKVLGFLMRESEKDKVNGVVWYLIGVIFSLHFYPADIACVSIMILSWADTAASVFGRLLGRYTPPLPSPPFAARKSLSGFLAAWIAGGCVALLFWGGGIAMKAERFDGASWNSHHAVLGASAPGWAHSGWCGWSWGFRGRMPTELADNAKSGPLNAAWDAASRVVASAASSVNGVPAMPLPLVALGAGLVAAVAEGLELGGLDDNLSLPILSGFGIWAWLWVWGQAAGAFVGAQRSVLA